MRAITTNSRLPVEYEPWLVEEALVRAIRGHIRETEFRGERDRIYEYEDAERREVAFQELHARWFGALGLDAPLAQALEELPSLAREARLCRIVGAKGRRKQGADLYVHTDASLGGPRERRSILIRLTPSAFLDPQALLDLLRHELLHVADMLDPAFGYEPSLRYAGSDPSLETLIRNRYRALWNATVAGRLSRLGRARDGTRERCLADFSSVFPVSADDAESAFAQWFDTPDHTHSQLVAFAHRPGVGTSRCPLCKAAAFGLQSPQLEPAVVEAIRLDYADWTPDAGLCQQCADLYGSRARAARDAALLAHGCAPHGA